MSEVDDSPYIVEIYAPEATHVFPFDASDWQDAERTADLIAKAQYPNAPYYITYTVTHDDMSTESVTWQPGNYALHPELSEE